MTFQHAFGQFTQATKCGLAQPIPAKWDKKKSPIGTSQQILWITHTQAVSIDGETLPKPVANPRSGLSFCGWGNPAWETYGKLIGAWIDQRWRTLSPDWWKLMAWRSKKILENQGSQQSQHVTTLPCSVCAESCDVSRMTSLGLKGPVWLTQRAQGLEANWIRASNVFAWKAPILQIPCRILQKTVRRFPSICALNGISPSL